jgi:DNA-binding NtrC family response regulator
MNLQAIKQRFGIIGNSAALENALQTAVRVAPTDLTVLITGQSGVGKEVFSKIIHELSSRKHAQFIAVNCGAIPEGTINSELFGHEKGAFTGAGETRKGYFETVDGGTIFLDEIGEMPLDTQTHLLRILENGEFMRVGSSKVLKTNVRVIAATNVSLLENVERRKFREDLYYRLSTVPIRVPSLRERPEDIYLLFRKFAIDFAERYRTQSVQLDAEAKILLENYEFPGNIRQLKNIAEQISALAAEKIVGAEELVSFLPRDAFPQRGLIAAANSREAPMSERDILYKLLFDLKHDMNELKGWVFQLVQDNNLRMPAAMQQLPAPYIPANDYETTAAENTPPNHYPAWQTNGQQQQQPIIINTNATQQPAYQAVDTTDDDFSIEGMEKEMIKRALKKHRNRRAEAATELGISERTLYRKIRQYAIKV